MTIATLKRNLLKYRILRGVDTLYNVKFFKYPSGWQVRVYDSVVGYHDNSSDCIIKDDDNGFYPLWDMELGQYVYQRVKKGYGDTWYNPFTEREEKAPVEWDEDEILKKKKRSIASSMGRTINAVYEKARANIWDWFITLTFNPEKVDSFDYQSVVKSLKNWIDYIRRFSPDIGYIIVPEKHESGRFHFHGLFRSCDGLQFVSSGKTDKKGNLIYNVGAYKLGWSTATRINDQSKVTKYIAKYISKDLVQVAFNKKRYWASRNLLDPEVVEVVLDRQKQEMLVSRLADKASHIKKIENGEVVTTYFEIPEGVCNEEW